MDDLRTPLARARGLGSGKTGTEHFWVQRVTAIALALLVPWLLYLLISMAGHDAAHAIALIREPLNGIRHLAWDSGRGFDIPAAYKSGYAVFVLTAVITAVIWFLAMGGVR